MNARAAGLLAIVRIALAAPLAIVVPSAGVTTIPGCGCSGGGAALPGLRVTVTDGPDGPLVCDASVTARDGNYSETLISGTGAAGCYYVGAYERPGTYAIEVVEGARTVTVENVRVTNGDCHVRASAITAALPAP